MSNDDSCSRRRVIWDEDNLHHNKAYFDAHPVTKRIDEPKTPYEPDKAMDEEGNFVNSDDELHKKTKNPRVYDYHGNLVEHHDEDDNSHIHDGEQWDEETKSFARRARMAAPVISGAGAAPSSSSSSAQIDTASSPDQSDFKKRRTGDRAGLSLAISHHHDGGGLSEAEIAAREQAQHEHEFKHMRKVVYAEEGAKFREQLRLAKLQAEADEAEDEADEA